MKITIETDERIVSIEFKHEIIDLSRMLDEFEDLLRVLGFQFDGKLQIMEDE